MKVQDGRLGVDHEGLLAKLAHEGGSVGVGLGLGGLALLFAFALLFLVALAGGLGLLDVRSLSHCSVWRQAFGGYCFRYESIVFF